MKILQSSVFRAICAIAVGIMLIKYPDNTVTWITIAIGVLFLLSGIISMVAYYHALKNASEYTITDAEGNVVSGQKPTFPIVGVGSAILGLILALTPTVLARSASATGSSLRSSCSSDSLSSSSLWHLPRWQCSCLAGAVCFMVLQN